MPDLLPAWPVLSAFLGAVVLLAVVPGPAVLYIVTRTVAQGPLAGVASVAGVALGNVAHAVVAALGLAALLATSAAAFSVVKMAGAAYLFWLAWQAWRGSGRSVDRDGLDSRVQAAPVSPWRLFRDGSLVALLNPKTTLFFAAFLPQFVDPAQGHALQTLALGMLFVAIAALSDLAYVWLARRVAARLGRRSGSGALARRLSAIVYLSLGLWAALANGRAQR